MVNDAGIDWHTCGGNVHVHVIDIPSTYGQQKE